MLPLLYILLNSISQQMVIGDFNGDGRNDVALIDSNNIDIIQQTGSAYFWDTSANTGIISTTSGATTGIAIADFGKISRIKS